MRNNQIESYKTKLKLTSIEREILVGTLLGDGHLETQNDGKTYRLKIEHSIKQKFYTQWLYLSFKPWVLTLPKVKKKKAGENESINIGFQTISHGSFRFYGKQFYHNGRKTVPKLINKMLTPMALAVWFMDDGSLKSKDHKALIFNTHSYQPQELAFLRKVLNEKYNIETGLRQQKDGVQLLIVEPFATRLALIIKPFLLQEFYYKLGRIGLTKLPKE